MLTGPDKSGSDKTVENVGWRNRIEEGKLANDLSFVNFRFKGGRWYETF